MVTGHYIFLPKNAPRPGDPHLSMAVLQLQNGYYGPISRKAFEGLADDLIHPLLVKFEENYRHFPLSAVPNIDQEDVDFFSYVMRVDPRQRPTAEEALKHSWFNEI